MTDFVGCEKAHAVSLTRGAGSAANHLAVTLIRKTKIAGAPADPSTENTDMTAEEIAKAVADARSGAEVSAVTKILGMTDVTKTFFLALPDDAARTAFLAKSTEDMNAEALAAKTSAETAKAREEAATAAGGANIAEVIKGALAPLMAEVVELRKTVTTLKADDVFKTRAATEFAGHPRGADHVVTVLKSVADAGDVAKKAVEATLTADIALAKYAGAGFANLMAGVEVTASGAPAAMETLKSKARVVAEAQKISERAAFIIVSEDPANAELAAAAGAG